MVIIGGTDLGLYRGNGKDMQGSFLFKYIGDHIAEVLSMDEVMRVGRQSQ